MQVQDIWSGTSGSYPRYFTSSDGKLFFSADDGVKGRELWTLANTAPVLNGVPASATIPELTAYTFTASATDADLPAQTLTFSLTDFDASNKVPAGVPSAAARACSAGRRPRAKDRVPISSRYPSATA